MRRKISCFTVTCSFLFAVCVVFILCLLVYKGSIFLSNRVIVLRCRGGGAQNRVTVQVLPGRCVVWCQERWLTAFLVIQAIEVLGRSGTAGPVVTNPPGSAGNVGAVPTPGAEIPHSPGQLGPCTTTLSLHSAKRGHAKSLRATGGEWPPPATAREEPHSGEDPSQ